MTTTDMYMDKSIEENAQVYFEKAKKLKRKLQGAKDALGETVKKINELIIHKENLLREVKKIPPPRKRRWFDKFRWFKTSEGFMVVCGRDATTNEILIKKNTEPDDLVFHTDKAGSPFVVIKNGHFAGEQSRMEAAIATASFSRAWKEGLAVLEVFYVKPQQVSKQAKSGESMGKGAFMIYGETKYLRPPICLAFGVIDEEVICAPEDSIKHYTKEYALIIQGKKKVSEAAKMLQKRFGGEIDEIIRKLPRERYR